MGQIAFLSVNFCNFNYSICIQKLKQRGHNDRAVYVFLYPFANTHFVLIVCYADGLLMPR